jgi:hypothetical protein
MRNTRQKRQYRESGFVQVPQSRLSLFFSAYPKETLAQCLKIFHRDGVEDDEHFVGSFGGRPDVFGLGMGNHGPYWMISESICVNRDPNMGNPCFLA